MKTSFKTIKRCDKNFTLILKRKVIDILEVKLKNPLSKKLL